MLEMWLSARSKSRPLETQAESMIALKSCLCRRLAGFVAFEQDVQVMKNQAKCLKAQITDKYSFTRRGKVG